MVKHLILPVITLALAGCSLHSLPELLDNGGQGAGPALPDVEVRSTDAFERQWWKYFADPVLDDLVTTALAENADIHRAVATLEAAGALFDATGQAFLPGGELVASAEKTHSEFPTVADEHFYQASAGISWVPDVFARAKNTRRKAAAAWQVSGAELDGIRLLVVSELASTYLNARGLQGRLSARRDSAARQEELVNLTAVLVAEGEAPADDLSRARAQLASERAVLIDDARRLQALEFRVAVLLGDKPGSWQLPDAGPANAVAVQAIDLSQMPEVFHSRPDIRIAEQALLMRKIDIKLAQAAYFPDISFNGVLGIASGVFGNLGDEQAEIARFGPTLRWNFLNTTQLDNALAASRSGARAAEAGYVATMLRALEETATAFNDYRAMQEQLLQREEARVQSLAAAAATEIRFAEGMDDYFRVLISRRDALSAEVGRVDALVNYQLAAVSVFTTLGATP